MRACLLSMLLWIQRWRLMPKQSAKRPVLRVWLPKATQIISVSLSVSAPSDTSQMILSIALASSKIITIRLPWLCNPAKASVLFLLHGTASIRHVFSCAGSLAWILVASKSNQWRAIKSGNHFASSAHVFVLSCVDVFAVTTPFVSVNVDNDQRINHETSADLPIPCPDATAI